MCLTLTMMVAIMYIATMINDIVIDDSDDMINSY